MYNVVNDKTINLNLKSTLNELPIIESYIDINDLVLNARSILNENNSIPGIAILNEQKCIQIISRKRFFEFLSKPYRKELYSSGPVELLLETMDLNKPTILPAEMQIIDAVQIVLNREKEAFDDPIAIQHENGNIRILDSYQLIVASSQINQIAIKALKEANDLKVDLLGMAAHDLKNPLNLIMSLTKIIKSECEDSTSQNYEMLDQIYSTSEHMFELIMELLNTSVIESGQMNLRRQIFDFGELVNIIIYQNQPLANDKNQRINYTHNYEEEFAIDGDALKIRESMENILSNAIKYSPSDSELYVNLKKIDNNIIFSVKDNGPGLTEEDMQKLFGKFQRLSARPTAGESSTGLGLYIAKQIIELHDGEIWAESTFGEGSTFYIKLPSTEI